MPISPDDFYAHAMQTADAQRRLPLSRMTGWEIFPFEPADLRVVPLSPPVFPEPVRAGENGFNCAACDTERPSIWSDPYWRLWTVKPSGAPLVLMLEPREHYDLPDLPDDIACQLGVIQVHIARAIESLPHIGRVHISRWGDGSAHLHFFFFARPAGFHQLRGTCLAIWNDLLPPVSAGARDSDARAIAAAITASYGGVSPPG